MQYENPCIFKKECRKCNLCTTESRPDMCLSLECEFYIPCKRCGVNMNLNQDGICKVCEKNKDKNKPTSDEISERLSDEISSILEQEEDEHKDYSEEHLDGIMDKMALSSRKKKTRNTVSGKKARTVKVTMPGTAPPEYSKEEMDYYLKQWNEYSGFYSDPTVFPIVHNLIILEIELNYVTQQILDVKGEYKRDVLTRRTQLIKDIGELRKHLPVEEASRMSEEETALSMIYDKYLNESRRRNSGDVKRIFDTPTIALAPVLHFKPDLSDLIARCGYQVEDAISLITRLKDLPEDPMELAKMFNFPVDEEFAKSDSEQEDDFDYSKYYEDTSELEEID